MTSVTVEEKQLNPQQRVAVEHGNGPLMIIAGAGTGKTTVITERIKHLIAKEYARPDEILALTFTEKAAREMEERVDRALPYGMTQMWISTFHAFCDRILRSEAISIGVDPGYRLMTEAETILFFRTHLFDFNLTYFRPHGNPNKFISGMITHFSRLKDEDISTDEYAAWAASQDTESPDEKEKLLELAGAYRTYEALKVKSGVFDYADLISQTLTVFRMRPNIAESYSNRFTYVLIDEFQDTNYAQNQLAIILAGSRNNITVVGDDDQAIYRWRGAAVSNMIQFRKNFHDTKLVVLTENYRSTKEILDRSYDLICRNNPDRLEVAEHIDKKLQSMRRVNGEPVTVIYADRVEDEAESVANEIKHIQNKTDKDGRSYTWSDIAILVRANSHAEPFVRALGRAGIPFQFLGPGQLFRQPEVKDLIAYLKVLYSFEDNVAMYRVLTMDCFGLSARDVAVISNRSKKYGISLFEACEQIRDGAGGLTGPKSAENLSGLIAMIHKHLGMIKKETAGQILYYFLEQTGLLKTLADVTTEKAQRIAGNVSKLFNKLKSYEVDHEDASVFAVVDWIDMSMQLGESPLASDSDWNENDAVNIMTIHSSKGLEFPVVFMVNLVSQRFPTSERKDQIPVPDGVVKEILPSGNIHEQEERRLCYVGMTRARDRLFFTAAKYYGEGKREKKVSQFVAEALGEHAVIQAAPVIDTKSRQLSFLDWKKPEEEASKKKPMRSVSYLSYSQVHTFLTCPLQYKYRYIIRIPVPPSAALTFGDTIHKTMKSFYESVQKDGTPTKEDLLTMYEGHWSSIGFGGTAYETKMKKHGIELLSGYYDKGYVPGVVPVSVEEAFKIKITPTLTLGGRIDRIDVHPDGALEIIDYKTGQAPKKDVTKDPQLSVYALSATAQGSIWHKKPKRVIVSFYFFEDQQKISATRSDADLASIKEEIASVAGAIETSDFSPNPGKHCDFCEFRLICEAWS